MKILFSLAFCIAYLSATAQTGFYLQPIFGGGTSNTIFINRMDVREKTTPVPMLNGEVGVGFQFKTFVVNTGLGFMRTGFGISDPYGLRGVYSGKYCINHIVLPMMVGFRLRTKSKISVTPALGLEIAYNNTGKVSIDAVPGSYVPMTYRIAHKDLRYQYLELSVFAVAELRLECKLSSHLAVMCVPRFVRAVSNMENHATSTSTFNSVYNYAMMFDAGVKWTLPKKAKSDEPRSTGAEGQGKI